MRFGPIFRPDGHAKDLKDSLEAIRRSKAILADKLNRPEPYRPSKRDSDTGNAERS